MSTQEVGNDAVRSAFQSYLHAKADLFCRTPWRYFAKLDVSSCGRWVLGKYPAKNRDSSTAVFQHAEWGAWLVLHCAKPPAAILLVGYLSNKRTVRSGVSQR
uniref:Uncharacterized protein n=1 Tax=Ralstonia solanacearum TaxID=305 RepID=A0A0S4X031_RALSL|nr:conserved protein of unknown function [Ralstonia solanacearum]